MENKRNKRKQYELEGLKAMLDTWKEYFGL
jgi:hypothetical protein